MHIFNRKHIPWFIFVCLATLVAAALYVANFHPQWMPFGLHLPPFFGETPPSHQTIGGTPLGLIFGGISLAIFLFAALLGLRKKIPLWRVGTVERWLRAHIWLTLLTIPLVFFHSGFHLGGPMTTWLVVLYAIVMASGIYGLALQHQMPRLMKDRLPAETVFEQIPFIRSQLCAAAIKMRDSYQPAPPGKDAAGVPAPSTAKASAANAAAPLATPPEVATVPQSSAPETASAPAINSPPPEHAPTAPVAAPVETAEKVLAPTPPKPAAAPKPSPAAAAAKPGKAPPFEANPASEALLVELLERQVLPYLETKRADRHPLANPRFSDDTFRFVKLRVAEGYRPRVKEIQAWCDERRMLSRQARMHHWLHGWLFVHVPISFLLILMTAWHAFVTLFRY